MGQSSDIIDTVKQLNTCVLCNSLINIQVLDHVKKLLNENEKGVLFESRVLIIPQTLWEFQQIGEEWKIIIS